MLHKISSFETYVFIIPVRRSGTHWYQRKHSENWNVENEYLSEGFENGHYSSTWNIIRLYINGNHWIKPFHIAFNRLHGNNKGRTKKPCIYKCISLHSRRIKGWDEGRRRVGKKTPRFFPALLRHSSHATYPAPCEEPTVFFKETAGAFLEALVFGENILDLLNDNYLITENGCYYC